jgi:hypothetical protein
MVLKPHAPTPVLTHHARQRCAEMGISTKVAKRIVQTASSTYTSKDGVIHHSREHPEYAVVTPDDNPLLILTVVFRTEETYVRDGANFTPRAGKNP